MDSKRHQGQIIKKLKHQTQEKDQSQSQNCFNHLPHEIAVDILSRIPITSLTQFTFVSRSLNSLSHDPLLAKLHLSRSLTNDSSCLVFHSNYPLRNQLHFLQIHHHKIRKIDTPFANSMPEFSIIGSCNGLLCLVDSLFSESIYVYNPFTRAYRDLPKNFSLNHHIIVYGFGLHPVTNEWKVIKIGSYPKAFYYNIAKYFLGVRTAVSKQVSEVQLYSSSTNTWTNRGVVPYRLEKWSSPGVLVNGRIHWISQWGRYHGKMGRVIISYDLTDDSFHELRKPVVPDHGSVRGWTSCHLSDFEGRLSAVVPVPQGHGAVDIWTMKEYGSDESWVKEYRIGAYCPVSMISDQMERSCPMWRNMFGRKYVNIMCVVKRTGEVVLEYRGSGLISYDPTRGTFKELRFEGLPRIYQTTLLVGSLISPA